MPDMPNETGVGNDAFTPTKAKPPSSMKQKGGLDRVNLADDKELVATVTKHLQSIYEKYRNDRQELDEMAKIADWMWKTGVDEATRETERLRQDRLEDDLSKTKAQKVGSTLFFQQVRALAALVVDVVTHKKQPFTYEPRSNPDIFASAETGNELANQNTMVSGWTMDQEGFIVKFTNFLTQLFKYSNIAIHVKWRRTVSEIIQRWPVKGADGQVTSSRLSRKEVVVDNRPEFCAIPFENFYADQNIGNIQDQNCIIIKGLSNFSSFVNGHVTGDYENVFNIDAKKDMWNGVADSQGDDMRRQKELNAGATTASDAERTGMFMQFDAWTLLPIDESKPKGKRWDADVNIPKKYWVTVAGNSIDGGVCLRIERNLDPDDEYPFEMIRLVPDDEDRLYHMTLAQALRGNFTEQITSKSQAIDTLSLMNNRPLHAIVGDAHLKEGEAAFGKDKVLWSDTKDGISEFLLGQPPNNLPMLQYLNDDSHETAGTVRTVRGVPFGQRTSANEAGLAYDASSLPHKMLIKYLLNQFFGFYGRKIPRMWEVFADPKQVIRITKEPGVYQEIRPIELYGEYDVKLTIVDDYIKSMTQQQQLTFAAQNLLPVFIDVLDKRKAAVDIFDKFLNMDVRDWMRPSLYDESVVQARRENNVMMGSPADGIPPEYVPPSMNEDFDAMLREHQGFRLQFAGVEDQYAQQLQFLDRHVQETEFLKKSAGPAQGQGTGSPEAPPGTETQGEIQGEQIAAVQGQIAGGQ